MTAREEILSLANSYDNSPAIRRGPRLDALVNAIRMPGSSALVLPSGKFASPIDVQHAVHLWVAAARRASVSNRKAGNARGPVAERSEYIGKVFGTPETAKAVREKALRENRHAGSVLGDIVEKNAKAMDEVGNE